MTATSPLVCNMNVFTPAGREEHIQRTTELYKTVLVIQEVENGYQFNFPSNTETIIKLVEFIVDERRCCPFLEFTLKVLSDNEPITLLLTGPEGTQEFLREEFSEAFA